ncbi:YhgE/Pip C-terminal domain [Dermatophilus congolensis]|uniref:YhgE/Pip C-terminal domain n=2 Tax=Dermatophilus congolensis TaxID=1863 RepID=A0A239V5G1_9MICO|nr:YhgE/Pip C-terminal domain [Dermatophilus congolensis]
MLHSEETSRVPMRTVLSHMTIPVLMTLVMALCYLGGFHRPEPHHLPVAIIGPVNTAGPVAAGLQQATGEMLEVRTLPSTQAATDALQRLEISGAYLPSADKPTLFVASAASEPAANAANRVFTQMAAKQGKPLTINDVAPLPAEDPIGQNAFFYLIILSIGSYATAISIAAAGATRRFRERLALVIGAGITIPTLMLGVSSVLFGLFPNDGGTVWAISVAYCLTVIGISVGLHTLVGRYSTLVFNALFVALNFTSSGGTMPPAMQPAFFDWLHSFWIGSGFIDVIQHVTYFPEANVSRGAWILIGWGLSAVGSLAIAHHVELRRRHAQRLRRSHDSMRQALDAARRDGLTPQQSMELQLAEDVAV